MEPESRQHGELTEVDDDEEPTDHPRDPLDDFTTLLLGYQSSTLTLPRIFTVPTVEPPTPTSPPTTAGRNLLFVPTSIVVAHDHPVATVISLPPVRPVTAPQTSNRTLPHPPHSVLGRHDSRMVAGRTLPVPPILVLPLRRSREL